MGRIRNALRKLENKRNPAIYIQQKDGSVAKFRQSDLAPAYINLGERGCAAFSGREIPPPHPLIIAARNSSDPHWQQSMYAEDLPEQGEDLSEQS
jgi:hypothetical protein